MLGEVIELQSLGDSRGGLIVAEAQRHIPFEIKRVYWIHSTQAGVERGFHAHKVLRQVAVVVNGSCEIVLDDGNDTACIPMHASGAGVVIEPGIWHYMKNFTADCVLLVFADAHYDEADYIRDHDEFVRSIES